MGLRGNIRDIYITLSLHMQISTKQYYTFSSLSNYFVFHLASSEKSCRKIAVKCLLIKY